MTEASSAHAVFCAERKKLLAAYSQTVRELLQLHQQQFEAIVAEEEDDATRFDVLIHMANEKKQAAKYAYLKHLEIHGCSA
jgi:hypothetical protein